MRIYRMIATFGKLQNAELILEPGLNIIEAPNEWGKSTWCAFLAAMLYGLDTRAKSTKTALADKERYAPWSGLPMSGRIDLCWQGRDITIERASGRRTPLGEFRAYETASGIPVPELTAANCGEKLLGTQQSVFRRAGFIRFADLPVTEDDALRRRLNALVTTGDENGDGEALARQLRDLKNRCRYNRTGLLPQAQEHRTRLEQTLRELDELETASEELQKRGIALEEECAALQNHLDALSYGAFLENQQRLQQAECDARELEERLSLLDAQMAALPSGEQAEEALQQLNQLREEWEAAQMEFVMLPMEPVPPAVPVHLTGLDERRLHEDTQRWNALGKRWQWCWYLLAVMGLSASAACCLEQLWLPGAFGAVLAVLGITLGLIQGNRRRKAREALEEQYCGKTPGEWKAAWRGAQEQQRHYQTARNEYRLLRDSLQERLTALDARRRSHCGDQSLEQAQRVWQQVSEKWEEYRALCLDAQRARAHYETLAAAVQSASAPAREDSLTLDAAATQQRLLDCRQELQQLEGRLWHYRGTMEALGRREQLAAELEKTNKRIGALEDTYAALVIAQQTLDSAQLELQRRFAPRIARQAQEILSALTGGRYQRLRLEEDLSLQTVACQENVLRSILWRSDGTVDQLYLALRLAVARELTPEAPLVLDDALVRFDDERLKAALDVLQNLSQNRQIILFTCQKREMEILEAEG